jgi:hypothetical protein
MSWHLTAGLQSLRRQVDARWPGRDRTSDGTIGDALHQAETSGHNPDDTAGSKPAWNGDPDTLQEVRAWDMDSDLREPGTTAQMVVDHIRALPGVSSVLRYMIYNRKMYHSRDGWAPTPYTGTSAHTEHVHFEGAWSQAADNNVTFNYRLEEVGTMAISKTDLEAIAAAVWAQNLGKSGPTAGVALQSGFGLQQREAAEVPPTVDEIVEGFQAAFVGESPEATAELLRPVLGDQAAEVGRLLAGA